MDHTPTNLHTGNATHIESLENLLGAVPLDERSDDVTWRQLEKMRWRQPGVFRYTDEEDLPPELTGRRVGAGHDALGREVDSGDGGGVCHVCGEWIHGDDDDECIVCGRAAHHTGCMWCTGGPTCKNCPEPPELWEVMLDRYLPEDDAPPSAPPSPGGSDAGEPSSGEPGDRQHPWRTQVSRALVAHGQTSQHESGRSNLVARTRQAVAVSARSASAPYLRSPTRPDGAEGGNQSAEVRVALMHSRVDKWGPPAPQIQQPPSALSARLRLMAEHHSTVGASREGTLGNAATSMKHFHEFMHLTGHAPLKEPCSPEALAYNETIMAEFAVWLSVRPSEVTGKPVSHSTAEQYVSMAKGQFMQKARALVLPSPSIFLSRTLKGMREAAPPAPPRKLRMAFGAQLLRGSARPPAIGAEAAKIQANEWALLLTAYALLLRPSEIAYGGKHGAFRPDRSLNRAHVAFFPNGSGVHPRRHVQVEVLPRKKRLWQRVTMTVEYSGGSMCLYTALRRLFDVDPVETWQLSSTPLVRKPDGRHFTSAEFEAVFREWCAHMMEGGHYTAYSLRIGGATDRKAVGASIQDVKASGRWDSDVADIYARSSVPREAALGLEALKATASDVEHAFPGYVQPARH